MVDRFSRRALYVPLGLVALAAAAWTLWWFVVAGEAARRTDAAAAELREADYRVTWTERRVDGWPYRTRVRFEDFGIVAPSGHALQAPELTAQAVSYALEKWVVSAPDGATIVRGAKGAVRVDGRAIRASVVSTAGAVPRISAEIAEARFTPASGAEPFPLTAARLIALNLRPTAGSATDVDLLFRIEGGAPRPGGVLNWMAGGGAFDTVASLRIANAAAFGGTSWTDAARRWTTGGGALTAFRAEATGGDARADASADRLTFGSDGRLNGTVALTLRDGPAALAALGRWGEVGAPAAAAASGLAAGQQGLNGTATVALVFEGGRARLGPIPLAPAPRLF